MTITRRGILSTGLTAGLSVPFLRPSWAAAGNLNLYNWADYIGESTIEDFQSATGISVAYELYASAEEMQARMEAGSTGYDLVVQSGTALPRCVAQGIYRKLDRARLSNWGKLDPAILQLVDGFDPGNHHGMPYFWGSTGLTVDASKVRAQLPGADLDDLGTYLKPENAAKLAACGMSLLDSPPDLGFMVLSWLGVDPASAGTQDFARMAAAIRAIRPGLQSFDTETYLDAMPKGRLCVADSWSGDFGVIRSRLAKAGIKADLTYVVPKTGASAWCDLWCMPSDAANIENAHVFLDYLLRPEVIARCSDFTGYANANAAATALVDPALSGDPAIYPDAATRARLYATSLSDAQEAALGRAWATIKA